MPKEIEVKDYTDTGLLNRDMVNQSSLLNEFEFTESLAFDQSFEGVSPNTLLPGVFKILSSNPKITDFTGYVPKPFDRYVYFQKTSGDQFLKWYDDFNRFEISNDLYAFGNLECTGVFKVDDVQVVSNRVIDARCDDAINSGDVTTDGVIDSLRDAMITHGLIAAA